MGKMSRDKGKRGELEVAALIKKWGWEARRGQQFAGGPGTPDVVHSIEGVHIEVKRTEAFSLYKALAQAKQDADLRMPIVFHRRNNEEWVAVLSASDLLHLIAGSECYGI